MRFLAVLITLLFLIVGGKLCLTGDKMYDEAQVFPAAEHVNYEKFAEERPLVGWYQISGGIVDLTEGTYRSSQVNGSPESRPTPNDQAMLSRTKEIYVPAHDASALSHPADIILFTRDLDLVSAVKTVAAGTDTSEHTTAPRIIKGMVRTPSELPDRIRRVLGDSIKHAIDHHRGVCCTINCESDANNGRGRSDDPLRRTALAVYLEERQKADLHTGRVYDG